MSVAWGEYYRYKDANGAWVYTDNYLEVPVDQLGDVEAYSTPMDKLSPEQQAEYMRRRDEEFKARKARRQAKIKQQQALQKRVESATRDSSADLAYARALEDLDRRKAELEAQYADLAKDLEELKSWKNVTRTPSRARAYNARVKELNERLEEYKKKRMAYEQDRAAFISGSR